MASPLINTTQIQKIARAELNKIMLAKRPETLDYKVSAPRDQEGGVFRKYLKYMNDNSLVFVPLNQSSDAYVEVGPMRLYVPGGGTLAQFLLSAKIAVTGDATKIIPQSQTIVAGVDTVLSFTGAKFFALLLRLSISPTNCNYQRFRLRIRYGTGLTTLLAVVCKPMKNVVDVLTVLPSNNAGIGIIQGVDNAEVRILANEGQAGAVLSGETLNQRDI